MICYQKKKPTKVVDFLGEIYEKEIVHLNEHTNTVGKILGCL